MLMRFSREAAAHRSRLVQLEIGDSILDCRIASDYPCVEALVGSASGMVMVHGSTTMVI